MSLWKPYQLKVFFSNKYVYASILHKAHPKDEGRFVAAANTLQKGVQAALGLQQDVQQQQHLEQQQHNGAAAQQQHEQQQQQQQQEHRRRAAKVSTSDCNASRIVGQALAQQAKALNLESVHFERARKQQYAGKLKALVEALRENGVNVQ